MKGVKQLAGFIIVVFAMAGCQQMTTQPVGTTVLGKKQVKSAHAMNMSKSMNFRTHLAGRNEVPAVDTRAQGQAIFQFDASGDTIAYKLIAANVDSVFMAHIHLGAADENGPVVVWLYPPDGPPPSLIPGRFDGVLAEGTITANDFTGPLAGESMDILLEKIRHDSAYVNLHTSQNPAGEIRGQIF